MLKSLVNVKAKTGEDTWMIMMLIDSLLRSTGESKSRVPRMRVPHAKIMATSTLVVRDQP